MKLTFKSNTIILLIGPSGAGKSFFSENYLETYLQNYHRISSDQLRENLLCGYNFDNELDLDKYQPRMMQVSRQAFNLLYYELEQRTSYPVNNDFIIVDSTGLNKDFRQKIIDIARRNHYNIDCIIFDFKNDDDYFTYVPEEYQWVTRKHLRKLRKETLQELNLKDFGQKIKIKDRNWDDIEVEVEPQEGKVLYLSGPAYIIADVHECTDELKELTDKFENKQAEIILIGDYIDKLNNVRSIIEYLTYERADIIPIRGNHENFVYKYLKGIIKFEDRDFLNKNFTSIFEFEQDEDLKQKFFKIYERSFDIVKGPNYIVTHAPCHEKYLGKIDKTSIRAQRNFRHSHLTDDQLKEELKFLENQQEGCYPFHVWGHIALKNIFRNKCEIGIDGGCYAGGQLNAVYITDRKPSFISVKSKQPKTETLLDLDYRPPKEFSVSSKDMRRIHSFIKNGVNFLSGTMCPADKIDNNLESLEWALSYYKEHGIDEVVLQKKMMGSRLNVYLFEDPTQCYSVTRNGFRLSDIDLTSEYQRLIDKFKKDFTEGLYLRILDCELLPWSILGRSLIDKTFFGFYEICKNELELADNYGFEQCLQNIETSLMGQEFKELNKEEFIEKYRHHIYENHKNYYDSRRQILSIKDELKELELFNRQCYLYGSDTPISIEPFSILKDIFKYGEEIIRTEENQYEQWHLINDDPTGCHKCPTDDLAYAAAIFSSIVGIGEEGVVVKPLEYKRGVAPYIKVRNPEYLRIIYGHDYLTEAKYNKLINRKRIHGKLKESIKEYNIGLNILRVPYKEICKENKELILLYKEFICEESKYNDIDPRL